MGQEGLCALDHMSMKVGQMLGYPFFQLRLGEKVKWLAQRSGLGQSLVWNLRFRFLPHALSLVRCV